MNKLQNANQVQTEKYGNNQLGYSYQDVCPTYEARTLSAGLHVGVGHRHPIFIIYL